MEILNKKDRARVRGVLRRARALIRKGWAQRDYALDADGNGVDTSSPEACQFCMLGALEHETFGKNIPPLIEARAHGAIRSAILGRAVGPGEYVSITAYNDMERRTKDEVLVKFDEAIASIPT